MEESARTPSQSPTTRPLEPVSLEDRFLSSYFGVTLAAGAYALSGLPVLLIFLFSATNQKAISIGLSEIIIGIAALLIFICIPVMMSAAILWCLFALLTGLFNRTLGGIWPPPLRAGIAGGMVAYTMATPLYSYVLVDFDLLLATVITLLGPCLAMCFGYLGAIIGLLRGARANRTRPGVREIFFGQNDSPEPNYRFTTRQLLVLTGWVGALVAVIRAAYPDDPYVAVWVFAYFPIQLLIVFSFRGYINRRVHKVIDELAPVCFDTTTVD